MWTRSFFGLRGSRVMHGGNRITRPRKPYNVEMEHVENPPPKQVGVGYFVRLTPSVPCSKAHAYCSVKEGSLF